MAKFATVEGNIGCGKSSVLQNLSDRFHVIPEPVGKWQQVSVGGLTPVNLLDAFYKDSHKWGFHFQSMVFNSMSLPFNVNGDRPLIAERSIFTARHVFTELMYEDGIISPLEFSILDVMFKNLIEQRTLPSVMIYLRTSPEVAHQRLLLRNRKEEETVGFTYLEKVHLKYEAYVEQFRNTFDIHVIEADCSAVEVAKKVVEVLEMFGRPSLAL